MKAKGPAKHLVMYITTLEPRTPVSGSPKINSAELAKPSNSVYLPDDTEKLWPSKINMIKVRGGSQENASLMEDIFSQ